MLPNLVSSDGEGGMAHDELQKDSFMKGWYTTERMRTWTAPSNVVVKSPLAKTTYAEVTPLSVVPMDGATPPPPPPIGSTQAAGITSSTAGRFSIPKVADKRADISAVMRSVTENYDKLQRVEDHLKAHLTAQDERIEVLIAQQAQLLDTLTARRGGVGSIRASDKAGHVEFAPEIPARSSNDRFVSEEIVKITPLQKASQKHAVSHASDDKAAVADGESAAEKQRAASRGESRMESRLGSSVSSKVTVTSKASKETSQASTASTARFWRMGRSPGAFVPEDSEVHIDGESSCAMAWRMYKTLVCSTNFDYIIGIVIALNAVFLGIQIDNKARSRAPTGVLSDDPFEFTIVESVFAAIFVSELLLRIIALQHRYFCSGWNLFDFFIVLLIAVEESMKWGVGDSLASNLSVLRVVRILRLTRALRIIRIVRAFRELRIVVTSILFCLRSLIWTLALLFVFFYVMAIVILDELTALEDPYGGPSHLAAKRAELFPNLPRSLVSLFQTVTHGFSWGEASAALEEAIPYIYVVWILYIGFVMFAIKNVVTGMFVNQAERCGFEDERNMMQEDRDRRESMLATLRSILHKSDDRGLGQISREAMEIVLTMPETRRLFRQFDIDGRDMLAFFDLTAHPEGTLALADVDQFIRGSFRLRGPAKNVDVVALTFQHIKFLRENLKDRDRIKMIDKIVKGSLILPSP